MLIRYSIQRYGEDPWTEAIRSMGRNFIERNRYFSPSTYNPMSNVTIQNAVIGSEVILLAGNKFGDSEVNPVWGGSQGKVKGKVTHVYPTYILVKWENNCSNCYCDGCLALAPATVTPVTLQVAVEAVIQNEFLKDNKTFSAYDVTSKVRREVNEGRVIIDGRPVEDINGVQTQRVAHDEIRPIVSAYMTTQSSYTRKFAGSYFLFEPVPVAVTSATPPTLTMTYTPTGTVSSTSSTLITTPSSDTASKLVAYIDNKGPKTLKQIQSRFKVRGGAQLTVRQLSDTVKNAGLKLDVRAPYYASIVSK